MIQKANANAGYCYDATSTGEADRRLTSGESTSTSWRSSLVAVIILLSVNPPLSRKYSFHLLLHENQKIK